jgi:hypothetical protein
LVNELAKSGGPITLGIFWHVKATDKVTGEIVEQDFPIFNRTADQIGVYFYNFCKAAGYKNDLEIEVQGPTKEPALTFRTVHTKAGELCLGCPCHSHRLSKGEFVARKHKTACRPRLPIAVAD